MILWLAACTPMLDAEELRDPQACAECHPDHVAEWEGSMHAHASDDPVFRAMNAKGQRETNGELGDFCVNCHAPLAVALGEATDAVDDLPPELRGVTCAFCHQVDAVEGDHGNPLRLADDGVLRGGIRDPVENQAHASTWSPLHDRDAPESSSMCGSCHDIVTPLGGHIERTYAEWQRSLFAKPAFGLSCGDCHMRGREGVAAEADDVKLRRVHEHTFPGVDVALIDWPDRDRQRQQIQDLLDDTVNAWLCVSPTADGTTLVVGTLENVASGHFFPSGATADRRVWAEVHAYEGEREVWASGDIAPDVPVADAPDPSLWRMWSTLLDADGNPTHDFWEAASLEPGVLLPVQTTIDPNDPTYVSTHLQHEWLVTNAVPDRITMQINVRPVGLDILDELVESGDLDRSVRDAMPTFTLGSTVLEWRLGTPQNAGSLSCVPDAPPVVAAPE
ncbi:MAG: hypothetical protein KC621_11355 [Myxococcales bacterium]|nr:hypothetical protein [Myxococcales bacterium]